MVKNVGRLFVDVGLIVWVVRGIEIVVLCRVSLLLGFFVEIEWFRLYGDFVIERFWGWVVVREGILMICKLGCFNEGMYICRVLNKVGFLMVLFIVKIISKYIGV